MLLFDLLFPPLMLLMPLGIALAVRPAAGGDPARARALLGWLAVATLAGLAVFAAAWLLEWRVIARHTWVLTLAMLPLLNRILALRDPAWVGQPTEAGRGLRAASLTSRRAATPPPRWTWPVLWTIALGGVAAIAARGLGGVPEGPALVRWIITLSIQIVVVCGDVLLFQHILPRLREEPEPMDPAGSPELAAAYARHRAARMRGFVGLALVLTVLGTATTVLVAWLPERGDLGAWIGIGGGVVGGLVGVAGALFGVSSSLERVRINRLRRQLTDADPPPPVEQVPG